MMNESLCKILCHNMCCVIQSTYELGITATFWDEPKPEPTVRDKVEPIDIEAYAWI